MNVAPRPFNVLSVCSGGGGLDLGLERATGGVARAVVYVEREAFAAACLVARMEEAALGAAPVWDDLCTFDGRPWRGLVDCVAGGTPCQDLSVAGKQAGLDGERSRLFFEQVRVADECEAPFFFWENVGGAARALPAVFAELSKHGYTGAVVALRASDVGAPHSRRRFFLLAHRRGVRLSEFRAWNHDDGCDAPGNEPHRRDAGVGDAERAAAQLPRGPGVLRGSECSTGGTGHPTAGCESRPAGADVADTASERRRQGRPESDAQGQTLADGTGSSRGVADASGARLEGGERAEAPREGAGAPRPAAQRGRPLEWPPGPGDVEGWARVASVAPHLVPSQPGIRRMADGVAAGLVPAGRGLAEWWQPELDAMWADRLRLLGNGVVPAQAAAAFTFLWQHLERKQR